METESGGAIGTARQMPALLRVPGLILLSLLTAAGAIDGTVLVAGTLPGSSFPFIGYVEMILLLTGAATGATILAVLGGNLVIRSTRGKFFPILIAAELVAVVLAVGQTWLIRNAVSHEVYRAFLLGSLVVVALSATIASASLRSIRSHSNLALTSLTVITVVLLTAVAAGVTFLVYAFSSSPYIFS